jgi:hypothetical protein
MPQRRPRPTPPDWNAVPPRHERGQRASSAGPRQAPPLSTVVWWWAMASAPVRSTLPNGTRTGSAVQRAVRFAAEPTGQPSTATANARWISLADLLQKIGRLMIVAVLSCPTKQTLDFSTLAHATAIEKRDSKMILSFLAAVLGRARGPYGASVGPDGRGRIPASSYPILKTVTDLKPAIPVLRACCASPPMKGSREVAEFAVRGCDVIRCRCVPEAKLVPQPTNRDAMSVHAHGPVCS